MMQFRDLGRQYAAMKDAMDAALLSTVARADFISGDAVRQLEHRLADYCGRRHCVSCANGTDALVLVLHAWGIGPGDAVFVPDYTFFASAECVGSVGAIPIFVDIDPDTFNMDPDKLTKAIDTVKKCGILRPRAVIAVDLFGLPADYVRLSHVARENGMLLLEDAAQGFGGKLGENVAGSFGDAATTSFFPAKPLGCYGDGGAIFTDDDELAALLRSLTVHGKGDDKYDNVRLGYNSRLDTIQAAVLLVKMDAFDKELEAVNRAAAWYTQRLAGAQGISGPAVPQGFGSSWAQYTVLLGDGINRAAVQGELKDKGIPTMVYYPKTMSQMGAFEDVLTYQTDDCNVAKSYAQHSLALPIHPYLREEEVDYVTHRLLAACRACR